MVVVDITDLDRISYGIVGFTILRFEGYGEDNGLDLDPSDYYPHAERDRPRKPLSATQFMAKFRKPSDEEVDKLEEKPLISPSAMEG
jgi:hypothetical protein